ncbi:PQQ-binding-like beta-propeller repeat protein [bacterium]|nr:PQQ-binding-like beta-propeller repeat protein [bacterium]
MFGRVILSIGLFLIVSVRVNSQDWRGFRGPNYNASLSGTNILKGIEHPQFSIQWKEKLGSGYSSVSVADGRAVTLFSDGTKDWVQTLDAVTGKLIWRAEIGPTYAGHDGSHTGPISTPLLAGKMVFVLGPYGQLIALNAADGKRVWSKELSKEKDANIPYYGYATSPVIDGKRLVIPHAAKDRFSVVAYDTKTGAEKWSSGKDTISYQAPIVATIAGQKQIVVAGDKFLYGVNAADGKILWEYEHQGDGSASGTASIQPLVLEGDRIVISDKADASTLLKVNRTGSKWKLEKVWSNNSLRNTYSRPVYSNGHLYGYSGTFLTCVEAATGKALWKSRAPGDGFILLLDGHLLILTKKGTLHIAEASTAGYNEKAKLSLFNDYAWTPPSFANGFIYARSLSEIASIKLVPAESTLAKTVEIPIPAGTRVGQFLSELMETSPDARAKEIDQFLANEKFPIIEDDWAHFIYRGEATDMGIMGDMIGARAQEPMHRIEGTDLFFYSTKLVPDARISYRLIRNLDENLIDPRNPRKEQGMTGELSWMAMPKWQEPPFFADSTEIIRGRIESHELNHKLYPDKKRHVEIYLPANYDDSQGRFPVVYIHDGKQAKEWGELTKAFDYLMGTKKIEPFIAVFLWPMDDPKADEFYEGLDKYLTHIVEEVIPVVDKTYRTVADPKHRANIGTSFAGYAALYCTLKRTDVFQRCATHSSFGLTEDVNNLQKFATETPTTEISIRMAWGNYDLQAKHEGWSIARSNEELVSAFQKRGFQVKSIQANEGHTWGSWRNRADWLFADLFK